MDVVLYLHLRYRKLGNVIGADIPDVSAAQLQLERTKRRTWTMRQHSGISASRRSYNCNSGPYAAGSPDTHTVVSAETCNE
jgi:hypothetical protein